MQCLAAYPSHVQACDEPFPNTKDPNHDRAEWHAAIATGAPYVFTRRWLCTAIVLPGDRVATSRTTTTATSRRPTPSYLSLVVGNALRYFFS